MFVRIDTINNNPLFNAYKRSDYAQFEKLIDSGQNINCLNELKFSLIHEIIKNPNNISFDNNKKFFDKLIESDVHLGQIGLEPMLINSTIGGNKNWQYFFQKLIDEKIQINHYGERVGIGLNTKKEPAIFKAIRMSCADEFKALLQHCDKDKILNEFGVSLSDYIMRHPPQHMMKFLSIMEEHGFDLNYKNCNDMNFLHVAGCSSSDDEVFDFLLKNIDINACDKYKNTALMYAARTGSPRAMQILTNKGADLNLQNDNGSTAAMLAIRNIHFNLEKVKILIDGGADLSIQNFKNSNVYHDFANFFDEARWRDCLEFFHNSKQLMLVKNNEGETAIDIMKERNKKKYKEFCKFINEIERDYKNVRIL